MRATARSRSRRLLRVSAGSPTNCGADSGGVASGKDHFAWRFRILPQRLDELVREQQSGLRVRDGAQPEAAEDHRARDAPSDAAVAPDWQAGAGVPRVQLS